MKSKIVYNIQNKMKPILNQDQYLKLTKVLIETFGDIEIIPKKDDCSILDNIELLNSFLSAKQVEGCSKKTIKYYKSTIENMLILLDKKIDEISTDDLRNYIYQFNINKNLSKTTIDNIRRIFSSFFHGLGMMIIS